MESYRKGLYLEETRSAIKVIDRMGRETGREKWKA